MNNNDLISSPAEALITVREELPDSGSSEQILEQYLLLRGLLPHNFNLVDFETSVRQHVGELPNDYLVVTIHQVDGKFVYNIWLETPGETFKFLFELGDEITGVNHHPLRNAQNVLLAQWSDALGQLQNSPLIDEVSFAFTLLKLKIAALYLAEMQTKRRS